MFVEHIRKYVWVHICGGFLISPNLVISAGSCIDLIKKDGGEFNFAEVMLRGNHGSANTEGVFEIKRVRHYDDYNCLYKETDYSIDVGLIVVSLSICYHSMIKLIDKIKRI